MDTHPIPVTLDGQDFSVFSILSRPILSIELDDQLVSVVSSPPSIV